MGKWADLALKAEAPPRAISANSVSSADEEGGRPIDLPPVLRSRAQAVPLVRHWRAKLLALNPDAPPSGIEERRWRRLLEDADWIHAGYGEKLALEGWGEADVFGVSTRRPGGEVLLDRLDGARSLRVEDEGRAVWAWSYTDVTMQAVRGYADRTPAGVIVPLWELVRRG